MKMEVMRAVLALLVVGTFMTITAVIALFPLFSSQHVELQQYSDYFAKTSSVYTGIVGVVVGYYFGQSMRTLGNTALPPGSTRTPPPR
jgi:hypothetical protein